MEYQKSTEVDGYIANVPAERQAKMEQIRHLIFETAPETVEMISQRMPSYKLNGKQLAYFANGKNHIGFFVDSKIVADNLQKLKGYVTCNSGFQLKFEEPLPVDLMREFLLLKIAMICQNREKE